MRKRYAGWSRRFARQERRRMAEKASRSRARVRKLRKQGRAVPRWLAQDAAR